ncbi:hypothetical protein L4C34_19440 [Vibrio profundum]|uniref:hypothetical protein n=1 Tax=Vibrio profundum TaxID=2910247 RepID=UPI003D0DAB66
MTQRNIHGEWTMSFENRFLHSEVTGPTNTEAALAWFEEMKKLVSTSSGTCTPWVLLIDSRNWETSPQEQWDSNNVIITWTKENDCCFLAVVYSNKIQEYSAKTGLDAKNTSHHVIFFDYDEAYQTCLDKLAEAQKLHDK